MGQIFNTKIIQNILNIEEKMFNSLKIISEFHDFSDINNYNNEIDKLKLYYSKENYLLSKIPDDINFYNYLFEVLKNSSFGLENEDIVLSRFRNILFNNYLSLQPSYEGLNLNDEVDDYDIEMYELKAQLFVRDNLLFEYIKSFDGLIHFDNDKNYFFFQ